MLTPEIMIAGYRQGIFPMAESRDASELFWISPERRGVFQIGGFHISRSLARRMRSDIYTASFDSAFAAVVEGCADREETWINPELFAVYDELHNRGHAHSVEVWEGDRLVGGVFGIAIGAAFFGESMFSRATDASKVALAVLHDRLEAAGFRLFDTQFLTPHLASLGAIEVPKATYLHDLQAALAQSADFGYSGGASSGVSSRLSTGTALSGISQRRAQTS